MTYASIDGKKNPETHLSHHHPTPLWLLLFCCQLSLPTFKAISIRWPILDVFTDSAWQLLASSHIFLCILFLTANNPKFQCLNFFFWWLNHIFYILFPNHCFFRIHQPLISVRVLPRSTSHNLIWLVVYLPLWKIWKYTDYPNINHITIDQPVVDHHFGIFLVASRLHFGSTAPRLLPLPRAPKDLRGAPSA